MTDALKTDDEIAALVERLRAIVIIGDGSPEIPRDNKDIQRAADAIERLAADVARLTRERDEALAILPAADKGTPIYKAVERVLDEHSAWIARPNEAVAKSIALAAGVAWMAAEKVDPNLVEMDRALAVARADADRLRATLAAAQAVTGRDRHRLRGLYIASKTSHGPRWRALRASGVPIVSTWIDESEIGATDDWSDLWARCIQEASNAVSLIVYREGDEILKGAWVEVGAALAASVPVFAVGCDGFSFRHHSSVTSCATFDEALDRARATLNGGRADG